MKLSNNFDRIEFSCKCGCGFDTVDVLLLQAAENARKYVGPFTPNSACRCVKYNKLVGGVSTSQHLFGKAIDIPTKNPEGLYNFLDELYPNNYGLGLYNSFVHIDVRDKKARWSA